ncbi:hypothetical protein Gpo141_00013845 [Globisporangium polare]
MTGHPLGVHQFLQSTDKSILDAPSARDRVLFRMDHLADSGVLPHLAISTNSSELRRLLHQLSKSPEHEHDRKLNFAKAMRCAVLCSRVRILEVLRELTAAESDWISERYLMRITLQRDDPAVRVLEWLYQYRSPKGRALYGKDMRYITPSEALLAPCGGSSSTAATSHRR